jgi:hypothetical protein
MNIFCPDGFLSSGIYSLYRVLPWALCATSNGLRMVILSADQTPNRQFFCRAVSRMHVSSKFRQSLESSSKLCFLLSWLFSYGIYYLYWVILWTRKSTLENFRMVVVGSPKPQIVIFSWSLRSRDSTDLISRDWGDIIAGCPGKALPAGSRVTLSPSRALLPNLK